jgi:hypothetical protein
LPKGATFVATWAVARYSGQGFATREGDAFAEGKDVDGRSQWLVQTAIPSRWSPTHAESSSWRMDAALIDALFGATAVTLMVPAAGGMRR